MSFPIQGAKPLYNKSDFNAFSTLNFQPTMWDHNSDPHAPTLLQGRYLIKAFPIENPRTISPSQAKQQATYESTSWEFVKHWAIKEGVTYPTLLTRGDAHSQLGAPGQSMKSHVFVVNDPDGSMFFNGEIYKTLRITDMISKYTGNPGEVVTQVWEGRRQTASNGQTYVFLASGIQDPDYPGGFGTYTDETSRDVTLRSDRSINVNFYYHTPDLPDYNFLMRVAVPDDVAHIIVTKEDRSSIKVKMHDDSICTVDIVLLDDPQASPIRVMLPTGIYALKKIVNPA